jgi:hypothetical protein
MYKLSLGRVYPNQCYESGSAWIHINTESRIRIRIRVKQQGPDPHQSRLLEADGLKIDLQIAMDAGESVSNKCCESGSA